jgi:DMSO reductase iron-sulfur subunit
MARYGMLIDLNKCIRCRTCYVACKVLHNIPNEFESGHKYSRIKLVEPEVGKYPAVRRYFLPVHCMHCDDAPCVKVCPTGASYKREDGVVAFDPNKCIGCKYCILACPYEARYYNHDTGMADKCDFCRDRVDQGLQPICVEKCIGGAIVFGDLDDPASEVNQLISQGATVLSSQLGTKPKVYYSNVR